MSTDPWCKKCPFQTECITEMNEPRTQACDIHRLGGRHLNIEDTYLYHHPYLRVDFDYPVLTFK